MHNLISYCFKISNYVIYTFFSLSLIQTKSINTKNYHEIQFYFHYFCLSFQIEDLSGDLEEKDQALAKAREALHKAKLQKYHVCEIFCDLVH